MKGQLVFEFLIAVMVFFGVLVYVINYLSTSFYTTRQEFASNSLESKAFSIGELLVLNKGNWSNGVPAVAGLAEDWPVLNSSKIQWLQTYCVGNYGGLTRNLGIEERNSLRIVVNESGNPAGLVDCGPKIAWPARAEARRVALSESKKVLSVYVGIW